MVYFGQFLYGIMFGLGIFVAVVLVRALFKMSLLGC
jgi:hypothetical protein